MHEKEHISHAHMDKLVCGRSAAPKPDNSLPALRTMPSHAEFLTCSPPVFRLERPPRNALSC